jgi:hypothetical protein
MVDLLEGEVRKSPRNCGKVLYEIERRRVEKQCGKTTPSRSANIMRCSFLGSFSATLSRSFVTAYSFLFPVAVVPQLLSFPMP